MAEWILSSSILILVLIALRTALKGRISLRLQYALWGLVLLRLLIPVNFGSSNISVANLTEPVAREPVPSVSATTDLAEPTKLPDKFEDAIRHNYRQQGMDVEVHVDGPADVGAIIRKTVNILWAIGCASVAGLFLMTNARFRRKIMGSRYSLGYRKNGLDVYATGEIDTPCLFGIRNPAIYVTYPVADDETLLRHTLEHEATHYRHGDHIWAVLRCVCLAVHWYNPLVWWAACLSQRDAELACDEATIRQLGEGERAEYGRTLISMTCLKKSNILITATTMNSGRYGLKERILLIARKPRMALYALLIVVLVAAVAVGCTFTGPKEDDQDITEELPEFLESYCYEQVKDRMGREDVQYLGSVYDYSLIHCSGTGPQLMVYRHEIRDGQIIITDRAEGQYVVTGGLSVNHLVDGNKHIYFGLISDTYWKPWEHAAQALDWKDLVFWDEDGSQKIVTFGGNGYIVALDKPITDFWVVVNGGNVALKMEDYLSWGYEIHQCSWYSEGQEISPTVPVPAPTSPVSTEIPDNAPPVNIPEIFHTQPDPDKICIAVQPTGLVSEGGAYLYIIPENQEQLMEYYRQAEAKATKLSWDNNIKSLGWKILYQDQWWTVKENGAILCDIYGDKSIASEYSRALFTFCRDAVREAGIGEPFRPEDLTKIKSAALSLNGEPIGSILTDPYALSMIGSWIANSRETSSTACPFGANLMLELEGLEQPKSISIATDSCACWMSNGVCYSFGEVTNVGINGNEEFYSLFLTDIIHEKSREGMDAMAEYWIYTNWRMYSVTHTIDETFALMDMFKTYAAANPSDSMVLTALTTCRGLDGAFSQYYAGVVAALFEADPAAFRFACSQMIPEQDVENAVNMLAFYWGITPEEARTRLESEDLS